MATLRWVAEPAAKYNELMQAAREAKANREAAGRTKSSEQEGLFKQVDKAIRLLADNPKHPGLHTHEYVSLSNPVRKGEKVFEAHAQNRTPGAYRVFWCYGPGRDEITIISITPHP